MSANDPSSSKFDPLLALYPRESETSPNVKIFDNVAVFEANLKRRKDGQDTNKEKKQTSSHRDKSFSQRKKLAEEARNRDLSKLKEMMEKRKKIDKGEKFFNDLEKVDDSSNKRRTVTTVHTVMEKLSFGPYSLLHRVTSDRLRCNVFTRHFAGLRGVLCGYVEAFDRYMNLAMVDVDETFCLAPRGKVIEHQKRLTAAELLKAANEVKLLGLNDSSSSLAKQIQDHLPFSGVVARRSPRKATTHPKNADKLRIPKKSDDKSNSGRCCVKRYNTRKPPSLKNRRFHGGSAQLYHRHVNNLYVRGDNIAFISLPTK